MWQPKFEKMLEGEPSLKFIKGLASDMENDNTFHKLIVLDDLLQESSKSDDIFNLFCRGSHHYNTSVIFITQNFFKKNQGFNFNE